MSPGSRPSRGRRSFLDGWRSRARAGRASSASRGSPGPRIEPVESDMLRGLMSYRLSPRLAALVACGSSAASQLERQPRLLMVLLAVAVTLNACGGTSLRELVGLPKFDDPSVEIRAAEPKWLLIKNPRFPDIPSEPEYVWVEEDKIPTTMGTLVFGKSSLIAPPEIVAKYGAPPGGGRISPRQKVAVATEPTAPPAKGVTNTTGKGGTPPAATAPPTNRGFVVFVDTSRVVIDLNGKDGVKLGAQVSVRRDKIAIVHPITGELLGELDEEVATGRVTEVKEKFSVVELQSVASGNQVKIKDRVVVR